MARFRLKSIMILLLGIIISVILASCAAAVVGIGSYESAVEHYEHYEFEYYEYEYYEYDEVVLHTSFLDDALIFIEFVENTHPIFVMDDMLSEDYYDMRYEFIRTAGEVDTQLDFNFALQRFITVLRDGHMRMPGFNILGEYFIDAPFYMEDGKLFLHSFEVSEIGGVAVQTVFDTIDRYFYHENEAARAQAYTVMSRNVEILERAGAAIQHFAATLTLLNDEGEIAETRVPVIEIAGWQVRGITPLFDLEFVINYGMIRDDIFLIDLRTFRNDLRVIHAETAIRRAVDDGVRNFVFDVRDNGGGNSQIGSRLLEAMGIRHPSFGSVRRSRSALDPDRDVVLHSPPSITPTHNPNDVTVAVLTNVNTFSSARMVSSWVQDGGLGVIVGEPGANAPTAFGNMAQRVYLPHSSMYVVSSTVRWLRPDADADQYTIWPDISAPYQQALEAAIAFFEGI